MFKYISKFKLIYSRLWTKLSTIRLRIYLWLSGCHVDKGLLVLGHYPFVEIGQDSSVDIGECFKINSSHDAAMDIASHLIVKRNAKLTIGNYSGMNGALIYCSSEITIGDYVNIGGGTKIIDSDFHPIDWLARAKGGWVASKPIHIGNYAFIGTNCIILKGVSIGEKSIVAAGSVVVKSIPEGQIWGGNPAKFIKNI